ncbi:hypothetical protein A2943_02020 [Candidatus Adlerbacteria bacterium RIFCSPLOWO2_01_FULL_51_16]|uniref:General secretion pathway GspH domain-containing protein n=1 Tax=Candidatus Adlerbacteria bacterium RIFCSPLOWO2_01_FULL_51_16 TaxID=1797243 RepID=A0A1F4XH71_9BACT|nr:MAG: hypothetical protein A2943_02020 [Candidatus Adlerbacteria bacterium RIFCSPLOWO2_01_FULL_51_16]
MRGFTLFEILLSVALLTVIFGFSYILFGALSYQNELFTSTRSLQEMLRRASLYASNGAGDSSWGVQLQESKAVLFKGTSFAGRDEAFDETVALQNIEVSGTTEYIFEKLFGVPQVSGDTTLASGAIDETRTITVNEKGAISVE